MGACGGCCCQGTENTYASGCRAPSSPSCPALFAPRPSGRGDGRADQCRKGLRAGLPHDGGTMVIDRALADAEVGGDVLAWMAGEHEVEDLPLTRGQAADT